MFCDVDDTIASGVGVVDRSVAVLAALADAGPLTLAELTAATGLPRPTAHRLATALEAHGLVGRDDAGRFRLGARLVAWGSRAGAVPHLAEVAQPVLDRLRDATGESAQLFVRDGDHRVCLVVSERRSGLRDTVALGAVLPIELGSGGKVLRAFDPGETAPELAAVRRAGYAASVAEREAGVASVSAPVRGPGGDVIAALSVSGPIERLGRAPERRLRTVVVDAARDLEARIGS